MWYVCACVSEARMGKFGNRKEQSLVIVVNPSLYDFMFDFESRSNTDNDRKVEKRH